MANLETLELTINANAASATEGIKSLTTSLIDLGKIVASVSTGLERLNLQIRVLQSSGMKISALSKGVSGSANKNPITQDAAMGMLNHGKTQLAYLVAQEKAADFVNKATQGKMTSKQIAETAMSVKTATERYEKLAAAENENVSFMSRLKNAFRGIGEKVDKVGSRFGRLASTMMMRTAIKALIKNFSEAWNAAYNFSKKMGGSFAKSIDNIKGSFQSMSINIVRAFAPLAQVVAPIISVIASGIKYLTDAIIALLKVIGIASDLFGATAENIAAVGGASGGATKDVLASFDELNVLDKNSGGGGGSGGSNFLKGFTEQIETVKVIVGEALLAVGLVIAFFGHPAAGIALAAIGAAAIAGTIVTKWGSLSEQVKGEITNIMAIAGGSMLAIGAIIALACPTKLGLGIALMVAGAANLATAVGLSWTLSDDIKAEVVKITAIVSGALLAIGAIMALAVPSKMGIGIALMAAGAVGLVSSAAIAWTLSDDLKGEIAKITAIVGGALLALGTILALACPTHIGIGIALMAAGAVSLASAVAISWGLSDDIKEEIGKITAIVGGALLAIGAILALTGVATGLGIAMMAAGGVSLVSSAALNWNSLKDKIVKVFDNIKEKLVAIWEKVEGAVTGAWDAVKTWAEATWSKIGKGWANIKAKLSEVWDKVKLACVNAWAKVSNWANMTWDKIKKAWEDIKNGLKGVWDVVSKAVSDAWTAVGNWINATWDNIKKAWEDIKDGLAGIWESIGSAVSDAWASVTTWISAKWEDIKAGWEGIKEGFAGIWEGIQKAFDDVWDAISKLWEDPLGMLSKAWGGVVTWFRYNIVKPLQEALPGIFGEWQEPGEADDPVTALIMSWNDKTALNVMIDQLMSVTAAKTVGIEILRRLKEYMPTIKAEDIIKVTDWESMTEDARKDMLSAIVATFGREGLKQIKNQFPNVKASDLISVTEWSKFTDTQKFEFLDALQSAFGSQAVVAAAKEAGIDIGKLVESGMKSKDYGIRKQAEAWATIIKNGTESKQPSVSPTLDEPATQSAAKKVKEIFEGKKPTITIGEVNLPGEQTDQVQKVLDGTDFTITPRANVSQGSLDDLTSEFAALNVSVAVKPKMGDASAFKDAVVALFKNVKLKFKSKEDAAEYIFGELTASRASGGFVNEGQLFIAREAGPELVGNIGNHTAVANNDQIVAGIASGVASANQEQNALLRQQNALLRGILEKDSSVRLGASAELGRVTRQSLNMYSGLVGG